MDDTVRLIIETVTKMRTQQKIYFKSRAQSDLIESKRLEKLVDGMLAEYIKMEAR